MDWLVRVILWFFMAGTFVAGIGYISEHAGPAGSWLVIGLGIGALLWFSRKMLA